MNIKEIFTIFTAGAAIKTLCRPFAMKSTYLFVLAVIAALTASCGPRYSVVTGDFGDKSAPDSVSIIIPNLGQTERVPVENGVFVAKIPYSLINSAFVEDVYVIPDGKDLTIDFSGSTPVLNPGKSEINTKAQEFLMASDRLQKERTEFMSQYMQMINAKEVVSADFVTKYVKIEEDIRTLCNETMSKNWDNDLGLQALSTISRYISDEEIEAKIDSLSIEIQSSPSVLKIKGDIEIRNRTAEGRMFTDFTAMDKDGKVTSKFSDYVGKGNYVLVDFWASWYEPCMENLERVDKIYKKYKDKNFVVLGIPIWDRVSEASKVVAAKKLKWNMIYQSDVDIAELYCIPHVPTLILFGPDGTILHRDLSLKKLREALEEYFRAE